MHKSAGAGTSQNSSANHSTLRPRNARLISYLEQDLEEDRSDGVFHAPSHLPKLGRPSHGTEERFHSDTLPTSSINRKLSAEVSKNHLRTFSSDSKSSTSSSLWESFSQLQGIASTLLGSDVPSNSRGKVGGKPGTQPWLKSNKTFTSPLLADDWGFKTQNATRNPAQDAIEERRAMVQAKKREALLLASATESQDTTGKYKRRDSDADLTHKDFDGAEDEALVYLHRVQPRDTLAGVMIKYSCEQGVFRKVNRFWPNDNIQTRRHVFLPVEACSVRGRKVDNIDLLDPEQDDTTGGVSGKNNDLNEARPSVSDQSQLPPSALTSEPVSLFVSPQGDELYKHESWVVIPSFNEPVQIVRIPRRVLGYFPRARRKSNSAYTDISTASTPKSSFDMLRHPPTHAAQQNSLSLNASPVRRPNGPSHLLSGSRQRSSSSTTSKSPFANALRGPGGVGTLRGLRTDISRPGPEDDSLNRKFAQYLPDLAPPEDMPRLTLRPTPRATPRASTDSVRSNRSNSSGLGGDMGGAIEVWVRKFAGTGKRDRGIGTGTKMGEVIELETNSSDFGDIGTDFLDPERTPTAIQPPGSSGSSRTVTATEEAMLNERFPVRGRMRNTFTAMTDKDKDD